MVMTRYLFAILVFACTAVAAQPTPSAKSVLVIDAETHDVLFQKNYQDIRPIASITKLMNAVVVLDSQQPLDESITITTDDVAATNLRGGQTGVTLPVGSTLTRAELLHLALMNSQNRAAAALGRTYPGGMLVFIAAMNTKAVELGMSNTTFTDPTGLQNTNVSTAEDLAKLVGTASEYAVIRDFSTSTSFQTTQYVKQRQRVTGFRSTNRLVSKSDWNVIVQKTGYIGDAGRCMVVMTTIAARRVIMVILNTPSNNARIQDAISLKYWIETNRTMTQLQLASIDAPIKRSRKKRS
jgi:D-alanyl-D-alanine endopeptidase (penicillin-binding protein 7)